MNYYYIYNIYKNVHFLLSNFKVKIAPNKINTNKIEYYEEKKARASSTDNFRRAS